MRTTLALIAAFVPLLALADVAETAKQLDALYAERADATKLKELEKATEDALKANPADYDILWRASRLKYWQADGATNEKIKAKLGKESWDLGEQAVKANPKGVEGHYFGGIGLGAYSQGVGIMAALSQGLEGKFNERIDTAMKLDPTFDNAGPLIAKGRYHYELPWPKRDLDESKALLEKAIKAKPKALRAYLYLAQTQLKDGDAKAAKETLDKVFAGGTDYDAAEARRVKSLAKGVKKQVDEELD